MKVNIDLEMTPLEARTFFGLPDLTPVHEAMVERMVALAQDGVKPADLEAMMRTWMPGMGDNWQAMQKAFWTTASKAMNRSEE